MKWLFAIGLVVLSIQPVRRADPEVHLIPANYRGKVQIVFGVRNGVPPKVENGAHVYEIPPDGLLLTQASPNEGLGPEYRFLFATREGSYTPIRRIYTPSERLGAEVGIAHIRRGRYQTGLPAACDVQTTEYFVGNDTDLQAIDESRYYLQLWSVLRDHYVCP